MSLSVLSGTMGDLKNLTYGWPLSNEFICIVWDHGCSEKPYLWVANE